MERQFKVVVIAVNGKGNKIYKSGDVVSESKFAYPADELVKGGYIEEVKGKKAPIVELKPIEKVLSNEDLEMNPELTENGLKEGDNIEIIQDDKEVLFTVKIGENEIEVKEESDLTKKQIVDYFEENSIEFVKTQSKETLFEKLKALFVTV